MKSIPIFNRGTAGEIDPWGQWSTAVVFTSNSPLSGLNRIRAAHPAGSRIEVRQEIKVDADNIRILSDPAVARAVDELLALSPGRRG